MLIKKSIDYLKLLYNYFLIRSSGLFDEAFYLENNPDVAQSKTNPLLHYLRFGGLKGRDPSPDFSSGWYLNFYHDVRNSGINPLVHYLKSGRKAGRRPKPQFQQTEEEINMDASLIRSSGFFDEGAYLENNPDVAQANLEPLLHYLLYGGREGRDLVPYFYSKWYLDTYEDAKNSGMNPLVHYLKYGQKEGRESKPPFQLSEEDMDINLNVPLIRSSGFFDEAAYLEIDPNVAKENIDPVLHYLLYGGSEGRDLPPHFYSKWYLDTYEDVKRSGINPLIHYLKYGRKQGYKARPPMFKLSRMYDYSQETNSFVFEDLPEQFYLMHPKVIGSFSGKLNEGEAVCPRPYVSVIEDAVIFGGSDLVITSEEIVLNDEIVDFNGSEFGKKSTRIKLLEENSVMLAYEKEVLSRIEEGVLLSCGHDVNYFHWLVECLPKLLLIDELGLYKDAPLLIPEGLHKNLMAALDKVNVNNRPLIFIEPNSACQVERLIFPSALSRIVDRYKGSPAFDVDIVLSHKWLAKLSECLKGNVNYHKKPWRKLFLSRRKGLRSLENREQLELMLLEQNFEIVELDGATLDFQIELFSQASMIVAPTGAALTNMLYCQPGTKVVIFMSNHETTNYYFWSNLGAAIHLDVTIIAGERLFNLTNYWSVHDDYVVDPNAVLDEIKKFEWWGWRK